jgi:hypothetical protein
MSDTHSYPNYHEITQLSDSELAKCTQAALDAFMQVLEQGENAAEKAQLYNAYQDEQLKRLNDKKMLVYSDGTNRPKKDC